MAKQQYTRAPKRRIERVQSRINHQMINTVTESILHTCEDRKTLVRTIIQLQVDEGNPSPFALSITRKPRDNSVGDPAVGESLDSDLIKENIWTYVGFGPTANSTVLQIDVDLKSMRKMDPGDTIALKDIQTAGGNDLAGVITLFFKE